MMLLNSKNNKKNYRQRLQPIRLLNIYFTLLLNAYYMLIFNYFSKRKTSKGTPHAASRQSTSVNVTYTPQCARSKKNSKKSSSKVNCNAAITVKAISSKSSRSNTCQRLQNNNNNNNNNKNVSEHNKCKGVRVSVSVCSVAVALQQRFMHTFVCIKLLIFEYIANYFISMQIVVTKIIGKACLPLTKAANNTRTTIVSLAWLQMIYRTTAVNTRHTCSALEKSCSVKMGKGASEQLKTADVPYTPQCTGSEKRSNSRRSNSSSSLATRATSSAVTSNALNTANSLNSAKNVNRAPTADTHHTLNTAKNQHVQAADVTYTPQCTSNTGEATITTSIISLKNCNRTMPRNSHHTFNIANSQQVRAADVTYTPQCTNNIRNGTRTILTSTISPKNINITTSKNTHHTFNTLKKACGASPITTTTTSFPLTITPNSMNRKMTPNSHHTFNISKKACGVSAKKVESEQQQSSNTHHTLKTRVFVLLYHILIFIKWLVFECITNYFISMQIEATKNTLITNFTSKISPNGSNRTTIENTHLTCDIFNTSKRAYSESTATNMDTKASTYATARTKSSTGEAAVIQSTKANTHHTCNICKTSEKACSENIKTNVNAITAKNTTTTPYTTTTTTSGTGEAAVTQFTKANTHHTCKFCKPSKQACSENTTNNVNAITAKNTTTLYKTTTTTSSTGEAAVIKTYTRAKKTRRRRSSSSSIHRNDTTRNWWRWCCSAVMCYYNSFTLAPITHHYGTHQLKGICYIRLISFKIKRFLQIPYINKQSKNIIIKRLKNCLSSIKNQAYMRCRCCIKCVHRWLLQAFNLQKKVLDFTQRKQTIIKTSQQSSQHSALLHLTPAPVTQAQPQSSTPCTTIALLVAPHQPQLQAQTQSQLSLSPQPSPQLLLPKPSTQPHQQAHHMPQQQQNTAEQQQHTAEQQYTPPVHHLVHSYCGFLKHIIMVLVKSMCLAHLTENSFAIGARRCFHWYYRPLSFVYRSFTVLILLSSLWHGTECFHGSVKLTANTVKTRYGLLRGIVVRSSPLVEAYLGIPYASPPVGSLRFMPPITPSTWKNVRNADRFSAVCPQTVPIPPNGPEALLEVPRARLAQLRRLLPLLSNQSEDCLYLNIYVPYENRRKRRSTSSMEHIHDPPSSILATMLLIHGESYEWNSGNPYDGSELAAHGNIIVVTINFRLGIFGFLKTGGKESAQGNFGLMDLVAGLHWLKENLPAFGGDPQRITLLGHSTGAALANILMVSPVASDLVQRAVLVSGSALSPWAIQKNPLFVKRRVAEQTGCHGDMLYDDLAPCLRTKSVAELLAVKIDHPRFLSGFAPFIDGTVISPNADPVGELTLPLGSAIVSTSGIEFANFPKRDLIFCLTSVESYLDLSAQDLEFGFNETRRDRILRTFVRNNFHYHLNEIFAVLKNEYTDWEKAIRSPLSSRDATLSFLSDGHTAAGLIKLGYMHSLRGGRSYFIHFKHRTVEEEYPQRTGSVRGEDVPFWLGLPISPLFPHNYTTQEKQISRLMLGYLANFVKTGNPNQSGLDTPSIIASRMPQLDYGKVKRASLKSLNAVNKYFNLTTPHLLTTPQHGNTVDAPATLNLALYYNQRRSSLLRDRRAYYKRHLRSNSESNEMKMPNTDELTYTERLPYWDAYDVVNQLYMELGNKAEVQSHYRGHKLSMWLNLIPQLHKHSNINDQSMRHHQFPEDISNRDLYEGVVRPQIQTKPTDDEDTVVAKMPKSPTKVVSNNTKTGEGNAVAGVGTATTECNTDGTAYANIGDSASTQQPQLPASDNRSVAVEGAAGVGGSQQKDLATASTGLIGNLEMFRRFNGKQFSDYTTVLVATIAVGCFLLALNILIFAGIYHQREKRARDAKTKEELQDTDTSKNSSILKLNALAAAGAAADDDGLIHFDGLSGKSTVLFGEYNYYDEKPKSLGGGKEKLLVDLTPAAHTTTAHLELNWPGGGGGGGVGSPSTLDLLKTKHHHAHSTSVEMPMFSGSRGNLSDIQYLQGITDGVGGGVEMATYSGGGAHTLTCAPGLAILETVAIPGRRSSFAAIPSGSQTSMQFDYAVQSSDQLSFKDIEDAVKASSDDLARDMMDDEIPEPPPPPRSFQSVHHQQQQQLQQQPPPQQHQHQQQAGILRPSGSGTVSSTTGKKRVHIQEISV